MRSCGINVRLSSVFLLVASCTGVASSDSFTVCQDGSCDFVDVQSAIDGASDGDVIEIAAGTFQLSATLDLHGKAITLRGTYSRDATPLTVLDGHGEMRVLRCTSGETGESVFEHLSLANGWASYGAGVFCQNSSPRFLNCTIKDCVSTSDGAGMCNIFARPTLVYCTFDSNTTTGGQGGGMANFYRSEPKLTKCVFYGNEALGSNGGGMYNSTSCPTSIWCRFEVNTAQSSGGAVVNLQSDPTFLTCEFIANVAGDQGGAVANGTNCAPMFRGCLFAGNISEREGGGMFNWRCRPDVMGCEFVGNHSNHGGGAIANVGEPTFACLATVSESSFTMNTADGPGGAILNSAAICQTAITGCLFAGNSAILGANIANETGALVDLEDCDFGECCSVEPLTTAVDHGGNNSLYICEGCEGDVNCDGEVNGSDLNRVFSAWGPSIGRYDLNADGVVNGNDVGLLFLTWGNCP